MESTTLYYRQGSSDKIYQASIEPKDGGYVVNFTYGRRGATLSTGTKTSTAVNYDAARAIYGKLLKEKTAKGYTPGEDGTPYSHSDKTTTGIYPQLLNAIGDDQIEKLLVDPKFWMQPKYDGRRLLIDKRGDMIQGINRLGLSVALPPMIAAEVANLPLDVILDGESVGDDYHAFDVLLIDDDKMDDSRYANRHLRLMNLLASFQHRHIQMAQTAITTEQKRELFNALKKANAEGVVFKQVDAPYIAGRPASGGSQVKYKFVATASFIAGSVNGKRSVTLTLLNGKSFVDAGNVTIPPNHDIPAAGSVVEVRYLYAFKESGAVYQPVYLGARDDIDPAECLISQLKYKP
ncbi:MAG TPA: WGR domain-containing protein [Chthoniobacter sp.]|jgi:bifunctional non-homologous end joining protein LigD